jgi:S1-C subfamily serine protease
MHPLDLILATLLALATVSGWRRGFIVVVLGYAGLLLGLAVGAWAATQAGMLVSPAASIRRLLVSMFVFFLIAGVCHGLGIRLGVALRDTVVGRVGGGLDALGGALVALLVAAIAMWFVALTLRDGPSPTLARQLATSKVLRTIDAYAPRPPGAIAELRGLLARSPFPEAFTSLQPPVGSGPPPSISFADNPGVRQAGLATVQVESQGCGGLLYGSGFPVAADLVVTNAHVVAGTGNHRVITAEGRRQRATAVWFDPDADLALLRVPGLDLPVLSFDQSPGAPATGAVIGYPGGGRESAVPAAVVRRTLAIGRDIYSSQVVHREIFVLRARVRKGDSGGPVVDLRGHPIGVVFAASTIDPNEGYALTPGVVRAAVAQLGAHRDPVPVGQCAT